MGRGSEAKEKLIETAQIMFLTQSYGSVSVDKICKAAHINKGSFYHFFPSKRELLLAVIDRNWEYLKNVLYGPAFKGDLSPRQRIHRFFKLLYAGHCETERQFGQPVGCPIGNIASEMAVQDDIVRQKVDHIFLEIKLYFQRTLQEAQARNEIDASLDIKNTAEMLLAYVQGLMLLAKTKNSSEVIPSLAQGAMQLIGPAIAE